MKRNSRTWLREPARKLSRLRIPWLLPELLAPARPGIVALLIAPVEIAAFGASPLVACGITVGSPAPPASCASEFCRRISAPVLNACLPLVPLNESAYVHSVVVSRYVAGAAPPAR